MEIRPATRWLVNVCSVCAIAWTGYVIWGSFTGSGPWQWLVDWQVGTSPEGRYFPAATFAAATFAGLIPITVLGWCFWGLLVRQR